MRPVWKGSISFGLVTIPISLFPAVRREELRFRLLRASDLSPVNYKRVAQADGKEVPWDQIVKGYEYEEGKFVVLKDDDFKRVDVEATQTVDIIDFVSAAEIDPMYFQKPFYMEPGKGAAKAYVLLRDALRESGKVGIAKVVIKTRQYLAAVKPREKLLLLELMHFSDELVGSDTLLLPAKDALSKGEMEMAQALIAKMTDRWDPERYQDDYKSALLKLIETKVESGGAEPSLPKAPARKATKVIDLVDVLKKSLEQTTQTARGKGAKAKARRRQAA